MAVQARGGLSRDEVVFIETTGRGSLDYYAQKLAAELPVAVRSVDIYARTAAGFNVPLFSRTALTALREDAAFVRTLSRERALIHLPNHHMGRYGALLASPYVVTVHDLIRMLDLDREDALIHHPNVRDRLLLRLDRLGIGRAAHIVAVSEATKRDLVARLDIAPERVTVVYEGVDHARFSPVARPPVSYRYLLYVGSEQPRKDMPTLLRAFARIRADRRFSDYRLVKIGAAGGGEAPFRQATVRAMRDCGLEDAVQFLGRVPEDELPAWYSGAELFIFPSRYEGFGLPPLEAMACACPVLISDAAALREVGGGAALVAPAGDHAAFAARAIEILTNGALRRSLRQRGLARAATFSWARTARETMAVWDAVLAAVTAKRAPTFPARRLARTGVGGTGPT